MTAVRHLEMGNLSTRLERRDDGCIVMCAKQTLGAYPPTILERLKYWATHTPDTIFIAQRDPVDNSQWRALNFAQTWQQVQQLASALIGRDLSEDKPIAVLSGNSIEHALLTLAAMYVGIPIAPISPQYSLASNDHAKLRYVLDLITPGLVFADKVTAYSKAINGAVAKNVEILACTGELIGWPLTQFDHLLKTPVSPALEKRHQAVKPHGVAKFLFSSGSTGMPKAVINTHRMLSANQQMILQSFPFLKEKPVLVDWLPWNHTFGGNHNVGIALYNGGTYYIDDGKPTPNGFLESIRNLKEIAPTLFFNVPKGFEELVKHLRSDEQLRQQFFSRVKMLFYAGAGLSQPVWDALDELALQTCGERIMIVTGLGCTETAPSALFTDRDGGFAGWIGLPLPGVETKLVQVGEKWEIRFRGDSVTPGYWRNPDLSAKAFDEEGFFCTGDAVKFVDVNDPQRGLLFDGRISEDFKLDTGTWVSAGPLRAKFLNHFGNLVKDVVIVGRDRPSVGALVFPDLDLCREYLREKHETGVDNDAALLQKPELQQHFKALLQSFAKQSTGSASRVESLLLQLEPPSMDRHEITDKGSLNASAIQDNRAAEIDKLYNAKRDPAVISID